MKSGLQTLTFFDQPDPVRVLKKLKDRKRADSWSLIFGPMSCRFSW